MHFRNGIFNRLLNRSLILLQRCPKNHPAYIQLYSLMTSNNWNSPVEAKSIIKIILQFRHKYPELLRNQFYKIFLESMLPLLHCINDTIDHEIDYRPPYGI